MNETKPRIRGIQTAFSNQSDQELKELMKVKARAGRTTTIAQNPQKPTPRPSKEITQETNPFRRYPKKQPTPQKLTTTAKSCGSHIS